MKCSLRHWPFAGLRTSAVPGWSCTHRIGVPQQRIAQDGGARQSHDDLLSRLAAGLEPVTDSLGLVGISATAYSHDPLPPFETSEVRGGGNCGCP
jgi:hypothetical protein